MSCQELLKMSQNIHHSSGSIPNISSINNISLKMSNDLDCVSTISLNNNLLPSKSLHEYNSKIVSTEEIKNACECTDDEPSDCDLIEIHSMPSNFKSSRYKVQDIPFPVSRCASVCEQDNIEECLLDLDDYLEKMDNGCVQDAAHNLNTNRSPTVIHRSISSLMRSKYYQFDRGSKLRNTISCTPNKEIVEHEAAPMYATWNQMVINCGNHKLEKNNTEIVNPFNTNLDVNSDTPQISTNMSNSSKNVTSLKCNLQKEHTNKMVLNSLQVLTDDQIFENLIGQHEICMQNMDIDRPRQFGRRAERLPTFATPSCQNSEHLIYDNLRPMSAPASAGVFIPEARSHNSISYIVSDGSTNRTSRNTSPVSIESSTDSGESLALSDNIAEPNITVNEEENNQQRAPTIDSDINGSVKSGFNSYWPHNYSRTFALISCTLGLFNISRFAVLTINYGANFLIQFFLLSIIFGVPFLWLQMSLGAKIEAGPISMWKISPICIGIGISLIFVQYFITIYSSVVVVWLLVYIRDVLINHSSYPWSGSIHPIISRHSSHIYTNLTDSIPDYLNVNVLQRLHILKINDGKDEHFHISDRVAFYLVVLWTTVFLILCKGLKSFGKIILFLGFLPITVLTAIAIKLLIVVDFSKLQKVFVSTEFDEFLINSKTWTAAAQETFLTWGLLGTSVIALSSRTHKTSSKLTLRTDALFIVLVTFIGLCLSALIGLCSIQIVNESGYVYVPGSYEQPEYYSALFVLESSSSDLISYPTKFVPHYSTLIGEVYRRHTDIKKVSGYQVLRLVTELLPAVVAISTKNISWIWTLVIFITFLIFGVLQLCVMWKPISCALGNSSSAVLLSCVTGLLLSIPLATEIGLTILHYVDFLLGGAWFIPVLWAAEIFGVFLIRGRPYNGDDLVNDLRMSGTMSAFLALSWNVLLPIGLITLAVIEYKTSLSSQLYHWRGKSYFNFWLRKLGALTQIGFLLLVPISTIIQIYRYLTSGPPDVLDRIQLLYRPLDELENIRTTNRINANIGYSRYHDESNSNSAIRQFQDDAPPKYTPPPSYTTATGARLAKTLRQSLRRSVRRILGESGRPRLTLPIQHEILNEPPVLCSGSETGNEISTAISESMEIECRPSSSLFYSRSLSLRRKQIQNKRRFKESYARANSAQTNNYDLHSNRRSPLDDRPYTAEDVVTVLRSSTFGRRRVSRFNHRQSEPIFCSIENLVQNAEPLNLSSAIITVTSNQNTSTSVI